MQDNIFDPFAEEKARRKAQGVNRDKPNSQDIKYADVIARQQRQQISRGLINGATPEAVARSNGIARNTGAPVEIIDADPEPFAAQAEQSILDRALDGAEGLLSWFTDPRQAAAAKDDTKALSKISNQVTAKKIVSPVEIAAAYRGTTSPLLLRRQNQQNQRAAAWAGRGPNLVARNERRKAQLVSSTASLPDYIRKNNNASTTALGITDVPGGEALRAAAKAERARRQNQPSGISRVGTELKAGTLSLLGNLTYLLEDGAFAFNDVLDNVLGTTSNTGLLRLARERDEGSGVIQQLLGDPKGTGAQLSADNRTGDFTKDAILDGFNSVPTSLGSLVAGIVNPAAGLTLIGGSTAGGSLAEGRAEGLEGAQLGAFAAGQTAIEVGTERIPFLRFLGDVKVGTPFFKRLARNTADEVVGEQAATALQDLNAWALLPSNQDKSFADYLAERPEAAASTLIATLVGVGTTNSVVGAVDLTVGSQLRRLAAEEAAGEVDGVLSAAAQSKLRKRDPEMFREFVRQQSENTEVENVYVPVEAIETYFQSGVEDEASDQFAERLRDQIQDARATGGDIVIPIADIAAHLEGTPLWEAIQGDARTSPGGLSVNEAAQDREGRINGLADRAEQILKNVDNELEQAEPAQVVYQDVLDKLEKQAGFVGTVASNQAALYAAHAEVGAARLGITAEQYHTENPVEFRREGIPAASPEGATVFDQDTALVAANVATRGGQTVQSASPPNEDPTAVSGDTEVNKASPPTEFTGSLFGTQIVQGAPKRVRHSERGVIEVHASPVARKAAADYMNSIGADYHPPQVYMPVDPDRARRIAQAFEEAKHEPDATFTKEAYAAMIEETVAQYQFVKATGLDIEFIEGDDPYTGGPRDAILDVQENNHLWVYPTDAGFGSGEEIADSPLLAKTEEYIGDRQLLANDIFRIVHDYFGHIKEGHGFRAVGEENAWQSHAAMYSPLARRALTTETRGQNSWLNYGPHGDTNRTANTEDTIFADQKVALLPAWASEEGRAIGERETFRAYHGSALNIDFEKFSKSGRPIWFTTSPKLAEVYSNPRRIRARHGARIAPVDLVIEPARVFDLDAVLNGREQIEDVKAFFAEAGLDPDLWNREEGSRSAQSVYNTSEMAEALAQIGYKAMKVSEGGVETWGVFERGQVQSPFENRVLYQSENPFFYSELAKAISENRQPKAPASQWKAILQKTAGIKQEELEWSGLLDVLDFDPKAVLTKEQLSEVVAKGGIVLEEELLVGREITDELVEEKADELREAFREEISNQYDPELDYREVSDDEGNTVWEVYDEGADEVLETHDNKDDARTAYEELASEREQWYLDSLEDERDFYEEARTELEESGEFDDGVKFQDFSNSEDDDSYRELLMTLPVGVGGNPDQSPSTHWDQSDVVAHLRFADREGLNGERVLFIEEIQSDWHQTGRQQGYNTPPDPEVLAAAEAKLAEAHKDYKRELDNFSKVFLEVQSKLTTPLGYEVVEDATRPYALMQLAHSVQIEARRTLSAEIEAAEGEQREPKIEILIEEYLASKAWVETSNRVRGAVSDRDTENLAVSRRDLAAITSESFALELDAREPPILAVVDAHEAHERAYGARDLARAELNAKTSTGGTPNAPFKTTWPQLVMKRAIRWAVDNGYDQIAWINGDQQNGGHTGTEEGVVEFYDKILPKTVDKLLKKKSKVKPLAIPSMSPNLRDALPNPSAPEGLYELDEAMITLRQKMYAEGLTQLTILPSDSLATFDDFIEIDISRLETRLTNLRAELKRAEYIAGLAVHNQHPDVIPALQASVAKLEARISELSSPEGAEAARAKYVELQELVLKLEPLYAEDKRRKAEAEAARQAALEKPTHLGFDITPELAEQASSGFPLFQSGPSKPRGQIALERNRAVITLFEEADLSTLLHETGHLWLEQLKKDANDPRANAEVRKDWALVRKWFKDNNQPMQGERIPREAHELFARGFERYLMEGKAPSAELQGAFAQFRGWLLRLYQVVQKLRSPITPEVRGVFDRLLATQEAIDEARAAQGVSEDHLDAFMAESMTPAEFRAYRESAVKAKDDAYDALLFKTMEQIRRTRSAKYRADKANVKRRVQEEVDSEPVHIALHLLRTGRWLNQPDRPKQPIKINREWLTRNYGADAESQVPNGKIVSNDGVDGDYIADLTGFPSGAALMAALFTSAEKVNNLRAEGDTRQLRAAEVEERTAAILAERGDPDPLTDGSLEEEAIAAINNEKQGERLATQIRHLAKRNKADATPYQIARQWAARKIAAGRVVDVASRAAIQRYTRASAKAAREAEAAILDGDAVNAFKHKQAQLLNHALIAEAKAAADRVDVIVPRMKRLADRAAMKSVDQDYMDRIHDLLELYDFRSKSQRFLNQKESFQSWAAARADEGFEVHVPPRLNEDGRHYSRVSVEELIGLNDSVQSLLALGRIKQSLIDQKEQRALDDFVDEIVANLAEAPARRLTTDANERVRPVAELAAPLIKIETLADDIDNGDPNGPMNRLLVHRASDAENRRGKLRDKVLFKIAKQYMDMPSADRVRLEERLTIPELPHLGSELDPRNGLPVTMTRMELLSIALNTGNASNLEKMAKGERWSPNNIQNVLRRELTKNDWDFVQNVWDSIDALWPDIVKTERNLSGVVPEKVDAMQVDTPYGFYRGGYYPVVYDFDRSQSAENNADKSANDLFGMSSGINTPKGHTVSRTDAVGPIRRSVEDVLLNHVEKVITRISYAEYARDVLRVTEHPRVRAAIDVKLGKEYRKQIKPWLQRQVNASAIDRRGAAFWEKALRSVRANTSIVAMGFRFSTGIAQTLGLFNSAGRIGGKYVGLGMKRVLLERGDAAQFVFDRSPEMLKRNEEMNRDVAEVFQRIRSGNTPGDNKASRLYKAFKDKVVSPSQAMAFWHIGMVDRYMVAVPTWLGAHSKAIDEGMTDEQASRYADKIVRNSQGSGREKDLAAVQSPNSEAFKFFTMFYTPFSVMFNAQWDVTRAVKRKDYRKALQLSMWFLILTPLADALLSGDIPDEDDDDETWIGWFTRNIFFNLFAGVPLARDFAAAKERQVAGEYSNFSTSPVTRIFEVADRAGNEALDVASGGEVNDKWLKQVIETPGYFLGLPTGQPATTAQFVWDYSNGDVDPQGFNDYYYGVTKGKVPSEE